MLFFYIIVIGISIYLYLDYKGPSKIWLKNYKYNDLNCLKAKDLLIQDINENGDVWATRGMIIYVLRSGNNYFSRIAHVPTGFNIFWLRNFSIIRKITNRPECIELVVNKNEDLFALSAGFIWKRFVNQKKFYISFKLKNYSIGNQGIRNNGILISQKGNIIFGEYFRNKERIEVNINISRDNGFSWGILHQFPPGEIRHIHAIQEDPFTQKIWFLTGDLDNESMIGTICEETGKINIEGNGNQTWRICQLVFTKEHIYWGTDTSDLKASGFFVKNKFNKNIGKIGNVDGAIFFGTRLKNGQIIFTSNREHNKLEGDLKTKIFFIEEETVKINSEILGTWRIKNKGFQFKYALPRIQRSQNADILGLSFLNHKEFEESTLLLIDQDELLKLNK